LIKKLSNSNFYSIQPIGLSFIHSLTVESDIFKVKIKFKLSVFQRLHCEIIKIIFKQAGDLSGLVIKSIFVSFKDKGLH